MRMKTHPFTEHVRYRAFALLILIAAGIIQVLLFRFYGEGNLLLAALDSFVFLGIFSVLGFFSWYTVSLPNMLRNQAGIFVLVLLSCLAGSHFVVFSVNPDAGDWFVRSIPLRTVFCVMAWAILFQWYRHYLKTDAQEETGQTPCPAEEAEAEDRPRIDRITVKDGSRIHIIPLDKLVYIQACGDYVTLFTEDGQYLKEQTMKSLIFLFPDHFVRIHRSVIVNSNYIARIELFEKQSYRLKLKNGLHLKVSAAGYKQLKENLLL